MPRLRRLVSSAFLLIVCAAPAAWAGEPGSALPAFQAVGAFGDLAVVNPNRLLSVATYVVPDAGLDFDFLTGLAHCPTTDETFVLGHNPPDSILTRVDFASGAVTTVGRILGEIVVDIACAGEGTLYALTDNVSGTTPHALFRLDPETASATLVKVLDAHGGTSNNRQFGGIAWNPTDGSLYYASRGAAASGGLLFLDRLAPGTFAQSTVATGSFLPQPEAMAIAGGRVWIATFGHFFSVDVANPGAGFTDHGFALFPSAGGEFVYRPVGMFPADLDCVPSPTAACLAHRFKVEVAYDAPQQDGAGNVILESRESVKFSFFNPGNVELIVKALNACTPPFNKWWVFAGGLTNVGVTIKVTDTKTGVVKTYTSAQGQLFQAFADTAAFACP